MDPISSRFIGRRAARMISDTIDQVANDQLSGEANGTNTGGISAFRTPFGQVVSQDSFRATEYSLAVVLVRVGPEGAEDYTDARYWAREVYLKQEAGATGADTAEIWIRGNGFWAPIQNLPEIASGTHNLPTFDAGSDTEDVQVTGNSTIMRVDLMEAVAGGETTNDAPTGNYMFGGTVQAAVFRARITAVTGSFPAWSYTCQRITGYDSSQTGAARWVTDGVNITGVLNAMEFAPAGGTYPYTYGNGSNITDSAGTIDSGGCVIIPIGVGAVVEVSVIKDTTGGTAVYSFIMANGSEAP